VQQNREDRLMRAWAASSRTKGGSPA